MDTPFIVKYQPKTLGDFQTSHDLSSFVNSCIDNDDLNLLLIGDTGTGKTSLLHIILNLYFGDLLTTKCLRDTHILFINSLREQGISFYRNEVKTFCQTQSIVPGKKKILILDDIDFINEQSQQVFRSCMDKYSENVNFLISCLNTQKVIESLQSRTTIVKLPVLSHRQMAIICRNIVECESINITEDAEKYLLTITDSSVRLLTNYLEKMKILNEPIELDHISELCSNINYKYFDTYANLCKGNKLNDAIAILFNLSDKGYSVMDILDTFAQYIKKSSMIDEAKKYALLPIICKYIAIFHEIHEDDIELALLTRNIVSVLREDS